MPRPFTGSVGLAQDGSEISGNGYTRLAATVAPTDGLYANTETLSWPAARPNGWGLITEALLFDDAGMLLVTSPLVEATYVLEWQVVRLRAGAFGFGLGPSTVWPWNQRRFGRYRYARLPTFVAVSADIDVTFAPVALPETGAWAPSEPCLAGGWDTIDPCQPGTWGPAQAPLRRAA